MMKQRRLVNSADNFRTTTGNQSPKTKKQVRFLDHSFAQELIRREKARLEEKIKSLRQAYDFRQTVSGNGEPITDSQNNLHTQERRDSVVPKKAEEDEDEEDTNSKKSREGSRTRIARRGLLSAERLAELSKPKSKSGTLPTNSSRRNAIVTASPEHLKLSIPERSPRTIPQLRRLSGDEVDYLVQPKTLHEFRSLTEISFPPSKTLRCSGRGPRPMGNGTHQQTGQYSFSARGFKSKNSSNHYLDSVRVVNADSSKQNSSSKPSFKMAALGVLSMKTQEREDLAPKSNQISISDLFTKSLPPKLALQQRAKSSVASFDKQSDVPGGRVLRLRPRKSAWLELRINSRNPTTTTESQQDTSVDKPKDTLSPSETQENRVSTAFTSSVKYHNWKDHKSVDVDELTKNLSKCSYLRGADEEMDIREVFAR